MQNPLIHIVRSVFGKPRLGDVPREALHLLTERHPYSAPLHLLYAKRLLEQVDTRYPDAVSLAALHFSNPHWLQQQLRSADGAAEPEEETAEADAAVTPPSPAAPMAEGREPSDAVAAGETLDTYGDRTDAATDTHTAEAAEASDNPDDAPAGALGDPDSLMATDTGTDAGPGTMSDATLEADAPTTGEQPPTTLPDSGEGYATPDAGAEDGAAPAEPADSSPDGVTEDLTGDVEDHGIETDPPVTNAIDIGAETRPEDGRYATADGEATDADMSVDETVEVLETSEADPEPVAVSESLTIPTATIDDSPSLALTGEMGGLDHPSREADDVHVHAQSELIHVSMPEDLEVDTPGPSDGDAAMPSVEASASIDPEATAEVAAGAPLAGEDPAVGEDTFELPVEPLHLTDFFASQGIDVGSELEFPVDPAPRRSFSGWLRTMKRLQPDRDAAMLNEQEEAAIRSEAEASNLDEDVITEAMAEVYARQGLFRKAIAVYEKLGLLDPDRSATFADRISQLKGQLP
jgi:hypothetical protein